MGMRLVLVPVARGKCNSDAAGVLLAAIQSQPSTDQLVMANSSAPGVRGNVPIRSLAAKMADCRLRMLVGIGLATKSNDLPCNP